jgi:hypothetical protein
VSARFVNQRNLAARLFNLVNKLERSDDSSGCGIYAGVARII